MFVDTNKVLLIVGGATGIGLSTAQYFYKEGFKTILLGRPAPH